MLDVRLNAVGLCQVGDQTRLDLPAKDDVLIHFVLKGRGNITLADGSAFELRGGMLVFVPPGIGQELSACSKPEHVVSWRTAARPVADGMIRLQTDTGHSLVSACGLISADCAGFELFNALREPVAVDVTGYPGMVASFELMAREFERPRLGTRALAEALMKQALVVAMREQFERGDFRVLHLAIADPRLLKVLTAMLEQPAAAHDLHTLSGISGMSRSLFIERFTATFGLPPVHLLKEIRLRRAADLLRNTDLPVQVISLAVGYDSRSYFSRAFRSVHGVSPRVYRELIRPRNSKSGPDKSALNRTSDASTHLLRHTGVEAQHESAEALLFRGEYEGLDSRPELESAAE